MAPLRKRYLDHLAVERWTSFENIGRLFPIDSRYKFGILVGERSTKGTCSLLVRSFAAEPKEVHGRHIRVTRAELKHLGGATRMIPEICSRGEKIILLHVFERGTRLFEPGSLGLVTYNRELDLTLDRAQGRFRRFDEYCGLKPTPRGEFIAETGELLVPLIEGRMVGQYDFFQKSWQEGHGRTAKWILNNGRPLLSCRPQFLAHPSLARPGRVAICDVTSATNTRTVHATQVPSTWPCGNTAPVLGFESERLATAGMAVLNSMIFDWIARRMVAGLHLNKFYLENMVWPQLAPDALQRIAEASIALASMNPRFRAVCSCQHSGTDQDLDFISAHFTIEQEVARGYGLSARIIRLIYDSSTTDRRGLWRYYASDPRAFEVVNRVITALKAQSQTPLAASRRPDHSHGQVRRAGASEQLLMQLPR
jgi:hypothetical protein